jgi:hypothetical protein
MLRGGSEAQGKPARKRVPRGARNEGAVGGRPGVSHTHSHTRQEGTLWQPQRFQSDTCCLVQGIGKYGTTAAAFGPRLPSPLLFATIGSNQYCKLEREPFRVLPRW